VEKVSHLLSVQERLVALDVGQPQLHEFVCGESTLVSTP
jgi:hypothetical protein